MLNRIDIVVFDVVIFNESILLPFAGHSHIRATSTPDASSGNIEAGNYYNTIGYSSFDLPQDQAASKGTAFHFSFYEPNTAQLAEALGVSEVSAC